MPRFTDKWVVDRTLFNYIAGGDCACCGLAAHLFNPDGIRGVIKSISDLETDAAEHEMRANERSPWPEEMRDQVWADRVRLRLKMKREMRTYREFFSSDDRTEAFERWCRESLGVVGLRRIAQMSREELLRIVHDDYGIHSAFREVFSAVTEQVANFRVTKYPTDARGSPEEAAFEGVLAYDRRGGFVLPIVARDCSSIDDECFAVLLDRMRSLGGPKLLGREPKKQRDEPSSPSESRENDNENNDDEDDQGTFETPSFRADRRVVRLLIARYWTNQLMRLYEKATNEGEEGSTVGTTTMDID